MSDDILAGDIKLLKSQVNLDTPDGGGAMTAIEIIDGQSNNLFPDVSQLDRTYGRINMRKFYLAVVTSSTASYFGSHVIISRLPADPRVSVTLMTTKSWTDQRAAAQNRIESYIARGPKWAGHLLETQLEGQRAIQLALRPTDEEPKVGQSLCLIQYEGLPAEYEQYVRATKVTSIERIFNVGGRDIIRKVTTVEISDPLRNKFEGPTVQQFEEGELGKAFCRDTRVANASVYYGASRLSVAASMNDASIQAESIFTQLVPSAQSETPMVDLTAASMGSLYAPGNDGTISTTINAPVNAQSRLYIGSPIMPGTLVLNAGGNEIKDEGGDLMLGSTAVGIIEYDKGLLNFNANMPSYSGNMPVTFRPAALPLRVQDTASIAIIQNTRGLNYTITLLPIPSPGSTQVSYMAQGKVYFLRDGGDGVLRGSDTSYGIGNINYTTGSVIITTGALPDADSDLIFAWGKASTTFVRAGMQVKPARITIQLANPQASPGSVTIRWTVNGVPKTATDNGSGSITGDATGTINYARSTIEIVPAILPQQGTEFAVDYQYGPPNEQTFGSATRLPNGQVSITLPGDSGTVLPKSVEITWDPRVDTPENLGVIFSKQNFEPPLPYWSTPVSESALVSA